MTTGIFGLHHIAAVSTDAQRNLDFYVKVLGMRLVKQTVHMDAPSVHHLFLGDHKGNPGSLMTLFPRPSGPRGRHGAGQATIIAMSVPPDSLGFWRPRLRRAGARHLVDENVGGEKRSIFQDPDGLLLALVECEDKRIVEPAADIPQSAAIRGLYGITIAQQSTALLPDILTHVFGLSEISFERLGTARHYRFALDGGKPGSIIDLQIDANILRGTEGSGTIHHVAFGVQTLEEQAFYRDRLMQAGLHASEAVDRCYFHSVYARAPGGILLEVATRGPGVTVDEHPDKLGQKLCLPADLEGQREELTRALPALVV